MFFKSVGLFRSGWGDQGTSTLPSAVRTALRLFLVTIHRAVIKGCGPGISPGCYECGPWLLSLENRRKIEPKEIPSYTW